MGALAGAALWIPDYLSQFGVRFQTIPGWETRGHAGGRFAGVVVHHIGIAGGGDAPGLHTVTFGRLGLRNALCNVHTARTGLVSIVAAGVAWHAGQGAWAGLIGNQTVLGNECEGTVGEELPPAERDAIERTTAALLAGVDRESHFACQHAEWAPHRKVDNWDLNRDPVGFRVAVDRLLLHPAATVQEDDDMARTCIPTWATRDPKTGRAALYRLGDDGNGTPLVLALNSAPLSRPGVAGAQLGNVYGIPYVTLPGLAAKAIGVHEIASTGAVVVVCEDGGEIDVAARPKAA